MNSILQLSSTYTVHLRPLAPQTLLPYDG